MPSERNLLLVDDDPAVRRAFRAGLTRAGYTVLEAIDGRTALEMLDLHPISLVLLDLRLPDIHGADLAARILKRPDGEQIRMVAVSGVAPSPEVRERIDRVFQAFLMKPVGVEDLLDAVSAQLGDDALSAGRERLVLIAHHEPATRATLAYRFRQQGFRVADAADGDAAIAAASAELPAALVSAVPMPGLDGFALSEHFSSTSALARIPVVLVSPAPLGTRDVDDALASGAWAYVQTSDDCEEALTTVQRLLDSVSVASSQRALPAARGPLDEDSLRDSLSQIYGEGPPSNPSSFPRSQPRELDETVARLRQELGRQERIARELTRITNRQAAQLSVLAGVSETLTRTRDPQAAIEEALARCMDVSVFTRGAAFLCGDGGTLELASLHGFPASGSRGVETLFGHLELLRLALEQDEIITLPSSGGDASRAAELLEASDTRALQLVPLAVGGQRLGVLVLGSQHSGLRRRGFAFARTIQGQLAQALLLGNTLDQLAISEQRFRRVTERMAEGLFTTNREGRVTFLNDAARRLLGLRGALPLLKAEDLLPGLDLSRPIWEGTALAQNGARPIVRVSTSVHATGAELERTHIVQDVTDARRQEEHLRVLAERDALTGLLNRRSFLARVRDAMDAVRESGTSGAVLFVDLDGFKRVNDTHGHAAGDLVLEKLAEALTTRLRRTDLVGRIGGDEFAVLQTGADETGAQALGRQILRIIGGLNPRVGGERVTIGASIGGVVFPRDGGSADLLMERADAAMYFAKRSGGHDILMWDADLVPPRPLGALDDHLEQADTVFPSSGDQTALTDEELEG